MSTQRTAGTTLIRTVDGVEWPAPGRWDIRPGWSLDVRRTRLLSRRSDSVDIRDGALVVAEAGSGSTLHLALGRASALGVARIDLGSTIVAADRFGCWQVAGSALVGDELLRVDGAVRYHGTFRAGWRANVWLDLAVVLHDPRRHTGPRFDLSGQITALAPGAPTGWT
jgi:hypothetical protein